MRDFEKDFEKWLRPDGIKGDYRFGQALSANFKDLPFSMQWGVYVDFFDEHDIDTDDMLENAIYILMNLNNGEGGVKCYRKRAREAAFEKAKEIYNNKI